MTDLLSEGQKKNLSSEADYCSHFRIGGVSIAIAGKSPRETPLVPSLMPFRVETCNPDIAVRVRQVARIDPASACPHFESGSVWRVYEQEAGFQFDFSVPLFGDRPYKRLLVDRDFSAAEVWMSDESGTVVGAFPGPLDYPLDELLVTHRLTQEKAIELHACGVVGPDGATNLFVGHSGAGKSTTARLWSELGDVEILSDDRVIVRRDHALRSGQVRMYGTPWHGESMFASPASALLARICVLEHGHENVLTRLSAPQAVAELFARSFVPQHRHEYVDAALEFLQELADTVPVYRFAFEPNRGAVERILSFRD